MFRVGWELEMIQTDHLHVMITVSLVRYRLTDSDFGQFCRMQSFTEKCRIQSSANRTLKFG